MPSRLTKAALLSVLLTLVVGCGGEPGAKKPLPSAKVSGTVQLAGKPLDDGEIKLMVPGEAPVMLPIKDGKFEGNASVGENHVEIRAFRTGKQIMMDGKPFGEPVKENYVAEKFNDRSELKAKVEAAGAKDLKFDVESKESK